MRAVLLLALLTAPGLGAESPPPNIVFLDVCSARADRLGAGRGLTPGLDAFAREAALFENAWAQSSWCLPNYATLQTGHRPEVHGLNANLPFRGLADWEETIAERLSRRGYRTGGFTAGVYTMPAWGLGRGFDTYVNRMSTSTQRPGRFDDLVPEIDRWLVSGSSRPFFLYATVDDLHSPYQGEPSTGTAREPPLDPDLLSVRFFRAYNGEPLEPGSPLAAKLEAFRKDPAGLAALSRRYDEAVRSVDRSLSRFLDSLKRRGLWDNTIVVVTADHGELLGEHELLGHTEGLYEPVLRVPLLVRHPRYPRAAGARIKALVERIDLPPTLLASAGDGGEGLELQGASLLPLLDDPKAALRRYAYASSKRNLATFADPYVDERALRDERWKLLWRLHEEGWKLYDLLEDPGETRDLSAARPEIAARLGSRMLAEAERARSHAPGRPSGRVDAPLSLSPEAHPE